MRRTLPHLAAATALAAAAAACGGSDDAASGCTPSSSVTVEASDELKFDAASYDGESPCVELVYENTGSVAHTLLVKGESGFKLSIGKSDKGTIELAEGTYELFCDVAGHEAAGMKADLVVS